MTVWPTSQRESSELDVKSKGSKPHLLGVLKKRCSCKTGMGSWKNYFSKLTPVQGDLSSGARI